MRILLINPPYQTITSNLGVGHQIPLGLLMVGGPLLDAGHTVTLLDAERRHAGAAQIARTVHSFRPDVVMTGHAGSTPAHPVSVETLRAVKAVCPSAVTVYGGVDPTYHAEQILAEEPAVDVIVRGEGERTALELVNALASSGVLPDRLGSVSGIAYRQGATVVLTPDRPPITDLDSLRVGWELIENWDNYQCFGLGRAGIVQFSRGCPHRCTYCGQHGFWVRWRHRDPIRFADEIQWLYRTHGIRFLTLADENPTTLPEVWRMLLESLARRGLPVRLFATIRAADIVRDADLLSLYRAAGILYVLMGIESTDDQVLREIRKGSTTRVDFEACRLLRKHDIFSIIGHIVGFGDERPASFRTAFRQLSLYDGDYLNAMYVTPHSWTPFARQAGHRSVIQSDQRKWDYRHQVLEQARMTPWQLFLAVKWLELRFHLRPRRLWAMLREPDPARRWQWLWNALHISAVWIAEVVEFIVASSFVRQAASGRKKGKTPTRIQSPAAASPSLPPQAALR